MLKYAIALAVVVIIIAVWWWYSKTAKTETFTAYSTNDIVLKQISPTEIAGTKALILTTSPTADQLATLKPEVLAQPITYPAPPSWSETFDQANAYKGGMTPDGTSYVCRVKTPTGYALGQYFPASGKCVYSSNGTSQSSNTPQFLSNGKYVWSQTMPMRPVVGGLNKGAPQFVCRTNVDGSLFTGATDGNKCFYSWSDQTFVKPRGSFQTLGY